MDLELQAQASTCAWLKATPHWQQDVNACSPASLLQFQEHLTTQPFRGCSAIGLTLTVKLVEPDSVTDSAAWLVPPALLEPATTRHPEDDRVVLKVLPLVEALQLMLLLAEVPSRESRYQLRTLQGKTIAEWSSGVSDTLKAGCPLEQRSQHVHKACKAPWWQQSTGMGTN